MEGQQYDTNFKLCLNAVYDVTDSNLTSGHDVFASC